VQTTTTPARFSDSAITFANGSVGENVVVPSANPRNYHEAISAGHAAPRVAIDGKLFLPPRSRGRVPLVVVVPGSLSVAPSHLRHAEAFTDLGLAAFVLDPFGGRGVLSTVANQTQFSFAASAYDVLATVRVLSARPEIDVTRVGLQGHSRGGTAVLSAAMRPLRARVLGEDIHIRAVLAGYPWCGHQFLDPDVGGAEVRVLVGDRDEWVSAQQAQGYVQAMRLRGARASIRIFPGAAHSFDRDEPIRRIPDAAVSPAAPTAYIAADGAFVHPTSATPDPTLVDRDIAVYALKAGYGVRGASLGSVDDQAAQFRADMMAFFERTLLG
jgi:dienelactone hydrolase